MRYTPTPIDTSNIELPEELAELVEQIVANSHDVWSAQRFSEGWSHGPQWDDRLKTHPALTDFQQLSEQTKNASRQSVTEALKTMLSKGYSIISPTHGKTHQTDAAELMQTIKKAKNLRRSGNLLRVYDHVNRGLQRWPNELQLTQLLALSLTDSGAPEQAYQLIHTRLYEGDDSDVKTLGILGRVHKDFALSSLHREDRNTHLLSAFEYYYLAYQKTNHHYHGVNAATIATILGKTELGLNIATHLKENCLNRVRDIPNNYHLYATLGEVCFILNQLDEALQWYHKAKLLAKHRVRDLLSTRRNAQLLLSYTNEDVDAIEKALHIPNVAVFAGHMIDSPNKTPARFTDHPALNDAIRQSIRAALEQHDIGSSFSSATAGADILFIEELLQTKREANIVLPYDRNEFENHCVGDWSSRYQHILRTLPEDQITILPGQCIGSGENQFQYTQRLCLGLARLKAQYLETNVVPIAMWDGKDTTLKGGTGHTVNWWKSMGYDVHMINFNALQGGAITCDEPGRVNRSLVRISCAPAHFPSKIMTMLFADVVHYSHLSELQIPLFVDQFMGKIAQLIDRFEHKPVVRNTWGDALYLVFENVSDAGDFALQLADTVTATNWALQGLPKDLNLRISMHSGPVFQCVDPIINAPTYTGVHASRAARMEPITPPGHVYVSDAFAALAELEPNVGFSCHYVGRVKLAKKFGVCPIYHLRKSVRPGK